MICFYGCEKNGLEKISRSVYYWQSEFQLDDSISHKLEQLSVNSLYIKFFDITWDESTQQPIPVADIHFTGNIPNHMQIVPVVFITNRSLQQLDTNQVKILSQKIAKRIQGILTENNFTLPKEIQIDCDWTATTRENYFLLLRTLKNYPTWENILFSTTIRLHQIKYAATTGIPPVDKGLLMFYNMNEISDINTKNSIYDKPIAESYIKNIDQYPLKLDAAIACFSWGLLFENDKLLKIFYPLSPSSINEKQFESIGENRYRAKSNFYFEGQFFVTGNILKLETMTPEKSLEAATQLAAHLKNEQLHVILFHLDEQLFKNYTNEQIEAIYHSFE